MWVGRGYQHAIEAISLLSVCRWGEGDTHLSILGIIAIVQVAGVGNKVEWGVILEGGTCIQQRARMLSTRSVGFDERGARGKGSSPARTS